MEEKIKIALPVTLYDLLCKDCTDFRIRKKNGENNMNRFVNQLLLHFSESFCHEEAKLNEKIKDALGPMPAARADDICAALKKALRDAETGDGEKKDASLSFKPTRESLPAVLYMESMLPAQESLSSFYRRMFTAYAQKTKTEREKILFREAYGILTAAAEKGQAVLLKSAGIDGARRYAVYAVAAARDELFNYVLLYDGKKNITLRLSSVEAVRALSDPAPIPEENRGYFSRQIKCGAQYPIYNTDREPIRVQLSEKGKKLFEKIYLYRPVPIKIEEDIYTFDCSASQALYYFERFGETALILSPKKLGIFMRNYYHYALKKYRTLYAAD